MIDVLSIWEYKTSNQNQGEHFPKDIKSSISISIVSNRYGPNNKASKEQASNESNF